MLSYYVDMKTGIANLPLHYGKAPRWLFRRMVDLAREISIVLVMEEGPEGFLKRVSDPFWFQAFGCVLGFDWHSSGLTTTVCGALKEAFRAISEETGLYVCGGKGASSRRTPQEIKDIAGRGLVKKDAKELIYSSRMAAKVDSAALQDGYQLYHHAFIFTRQGSWAVVQQGMNTAARWARRYHWLGEETGSFVCEPHKAICCDHSSSVLNMVARESAASQKTSTVLSRQNPDKVVSEFRGIKKMSLPSRHSVSLNDIRPENLKRILVKTYEDPPASFEGLLSIEGVGPKTIRALALISELIYGNSVSYRDPVKFSFAHGGKDGHPYPVEKRRYDITIGILRDAVNKAKVGRSEKIKALKRLGGAV